MKNAQWTARSSRLRDGPRYLDGTARRGPSLRADAGRVEYVRADAKRWRETWHRVFWAETVVLVGGRGRRAVCRDGLRVYNTRDYGSAVRSWRKRSNESSQVRHRDTRSTYTFICRFISLLMI